MARNSRMMLKMGKTDQSLFATVCERDCSTDQCGSSPVTTINLK
jgi:hypothetical protein